MNRLTEKLTKEQKALFLEEGVECDYKEKDNVKLTSVVDKLGQIEDIEEEREIDFVKLDKALKQGYVYAIYIDSYMNEKIQAFPIECVIISRNRSVLRTKYEDLDLNGKTWALTREELEKKGE